MGKTWSSKNRRDEKDFLRWLDKGKTIYVINEPQHAGAAHLWNHARTWSSFTVTGKHPLLRHWIFNGSPSNGAPGFLGWYGEVYEDQPRNVPHVSDPGPRVSDPLGHITKPTVVSNKQIFAWGDEAEDRVKADVKAGRRTWF